MNQFFLYSVKAGIFMAIFYLVYYLFLSRDTAYVRNRIYLLASVTVSWLLPLIKFRTDVSIVTETLPPAFLDFLMNGETGTTDIIYDTINRPDYISVLSAIYLIGITLFLLKLITGILRITRLILKGNVEGKIVTVSGRSPISGFSAMGFVFVSKEVPDSEREKIVMHETIHNKLLHYIDIVIFESVLTLQWMNPFAHMIRYSIGAVHEYHTDKEFISQTGKISEYQRLIFNQIFGTRNIPIASCFSAKSLTKKRLIMMTKKKTKPGAIIKVLLAVPMIVGMILVFSCNEMKDEQNSSVSDYSESPYQLVEVVVSLRSSNSTTTLLVPRHRLKTVKDSLRLVHNRDFKIVEQTPIPSSDMILVIDGIRRHFDELYSIDKSNIATVKVLKSDRAVAEYGEKGALGAIIVTTKAFENDDKPYQNDVFMIVEEMPTFLGGDVQKFSNWVAERVNYPEIAKENGIQGKIFIGFVVESDGSIGSVTILRSVDKSLDDEAVRVVKSAPAWSPGYQRGKTVRVRFSITVNFVLETIPVGTDN